MPQTSGRLASQGEMPMPASAHAAAIPTVSRRIAAGLADSPLTDMVAHTRHLESAYIDALARAAPEVLAALQVAAPQ